ncbi:MAG: DUF58 domain-containing protein [Deltaproteobacteria bacterium]|nr:DUF58 domain-containing protein [Deltaproteobacteria bacterium]
MFLRFVYTLIRGVRASKSWFFVRLTGPGRLVAGGILASALVGLDTKQTLAYEAFTFLSSVFLISLLWTTWSAPRALAHRVLPRFGTVGEPLEYRVLLRSETPKVQKNVQVFEKPQYWNPGSGRTAFESNLTGHAGGFGPSGSPHRGPRRMTLKYPMFAARIKDVPHLNPEDEQEVLMEILPLRRGRLWLETLIISATDPFGLCRSIKKIAMPQSVLILPKRYTVAEIRLTGARRHQPGGVTFASSVGDSQEFVSLREYQAGDPIHRIHWKSWAKTGKPIVKELQEEFFVRHALVLDTFQQDAYSEIFEEAVSIAASLIGAIDTRESLLDLMFVGPEAYSFTSGRGLAQAEKMLEILASVGPCRDKPFLSLCNTVFQRDRLISSCICVLLAWDEERKEFIRRLKESGLPLLVLIVVDGEETDRLDPGPMSDRPEHFRCLEVGKIRQELVDL